jgi:hypothetical protein
MPWTYEFDEDGGYDCMSAAYIIADPENDREIVRVDVSDFEPSGEWEANHAEHPEAKKVAALIAAAPDLRAGLESCCTHLMDTIVNRKPQKNPLTLLTEINNILNKVR